MDSRASAIQLNLVFLLQMLWLFSVFDTTVSRMLAWENALLHGIAAAIGIYNFRLAFLKMSFVIFITRINRTDSPQISDIFEPILASLVIERLFPFSSKRQVICDLDVMSFEFVSVSSRTTCILLEECRLNSVNLLKTVHESDNCLLSSTFQ